MKSRIPYAIAALLAAAAMPLAWSQAASTPQPADLSASPIASVSRADPMADSIAQALIAEPTMKDSKITVQPDENGVVLLTGVAPTEMQRIKAQDIAKAQAGEGKVINAITTEEIVMSVPVNQEVAVLEEVKQ